MLFLVNICLNDILTNKQTERVPLDSQFIYNDIAFYYNANMQIIPRDQVKMFKKLLLNINNIYFYYQ